MHPRERSERPCSVYPASSPCITSSALCLLRLKDKPKREERKELRAVSGVEKKERRSWRERELDRTESDTVKTARKTPIKKDCGEGE